MARLADRSSKKLARVLSDRRATATIDKKERLQKANLRKVRKETGNKTAELKKRVQSDLLMEDSDCSDFSDLDMEF